MKPPRGPAAKDLGAMLSHERNVDREEVPETVEVIEKDEALEEEAIKGKEEVLRKHDANKKDDASKQEKETSEVHGLVYKGARHGQRPPSKKEFGLSMLQWKHLEQERESQRTLPGRKNQVRRTGATGQAH